MPPAVSNATRSTRCYRTLSVRRTCERRIPKRLQERLRGGTGPPERRQVNPGQRARGYEGLDHLLPSPDNALTDPGGPQRTRLPSDLRGYSWLSEATRHPEKPYAAAGPRRPLRIRRRAGSLRRGRGEKWARHGRSLRDPDSR